MINKKTTLLALPIVTLTYLVYREWFTGWEIIGGDWPYYWRDSLLEMKIWPSLWAQWQGNGLGGTNPLLGLRLFQSLLIVPFTQWLGIPWNIVYKAGWFGLFIALSVYGSKKLWEVIDNREQRTENREQMTGGFPWWIVVSLAYTTNTYILMVTGGGQMGVALSYSLAPLVLASFIKLIDSMYKSFSVVIPANAGIQSRIISWILGSSPRMTRRTFVAGLVLGVQMMIDPRIAYVTMIGAGIYVIANSKWQIANVISTLVVPLVIAVGVNAFWALPMAVMRENPLGSLGTAYTSIESIKFFSFADFSHALSFLHPNWPENLFGKTYFLQPEFLILPILAFGSLLFILKIKDQKSKIQSKDQKLTIQQYNNTTILFFAFLGLFGVFLSKGAQEPFGSVYQWMFTHVPGFIMFRDPTKWYILVAISYSVLIPFTLERVVDWFTRGAESREHKYYDS